MKSNRVAFSEESKNFAFSVLVLIAFFFVLFFYVGVNSGDSYGDCLL